MKNVSDDLKNVLEQDNVELAKCVKITLPDGEILTFTEHSKDIIIDGLNYECCGGFEDGVSKSYSDITDSSGIVAAFIENINITKDDILAGKFDNAGIEIFYVSYDHIDYGKIPVIHGFIDATQFTDNRVYFSISGTLSLLAKTIGDVYSPLCRAKFCDNKCSMNPENYTFNGEISNVIGATEFYCENVNIVDKPTNYFKYGLVKFKDGKNTGKIVEIKQSNEGNIVLNAKPFYGLEVGDQIDVVAGCDKKFSTCINSFNNAINFRGEPNLPRTSKVYKFY
ncbi:MAG: DUF2163 domain-containing protein [Rickettsiales bacterium]|jgi:uncharacterized phage protein (TIGR02218 family)|nr:DUF2163 domain-containing protein [Rickettsiales bacterium]